MAGGVCSLLNRQKNLPVEGPTVSSASEPECLPRGLSPEKRFSRIAVRRMLGGGIVDTARNELPGGTRAMAYKIMDHGGFLRVAACFQSPIRRPFGAPHLPACRGRPDQFRGLPRSHADPRPQGSDRNRLAQAAGQGVGRRYGERQSRRLRSDRPRHAGAAVSFARRARAAGRRGQVPGALHVDHEHAAAALCEAHPGPQLRCC